MLPGRNATSVPKQLVLDVLDTLDTGTYLHPTPSHFATGFLPGVIMAVLLLHYAIQECEYPPPPSSS